MEISTIIIPIRRINWSSETLSNLSKGHTAGKCQNQVLNLGILDLMTMVYCFSTEKLDFSVSCAWHPFPTTPGHVYFASKFPLPHWLFLHSWLSAVSLTISFFMLHIASLGITHEQPSLFTCQTIFPQSIPSQLGSEDGKNYSYFTNEKTKASNWPKISSNRLVTKWTRIQVPWP